MGKVNRVFGISCVLLILLGALLLTTQRVSAADPVRQTTITVSYTEYQWWLSRWRGNEIVCVIIVDHTGLPTPQEIYKACGYQIYNEWQTTPACDKISKGVEDISVCPGLYFHLVSIEPKEKEILITLPPAEAWLNLVGCEPLPPENICVQLPSLRISGEEPLPNESITAIQGIYDGQPFYCQSDVCIIPLGVTPETGVTLEFWADSSFGDSSQVYTALVRVVESGVSYSPGKSGYFVDVLSTQWRGAPVASCVQSWEAFPAVGKQPAWLTTPNSEQLLASYGPYYYLAGRLIAQGVVKAPRCAAGGLLANGYADACGLEAARPLVEKWQNQFDQSIIQAAESSGVPAGLLKNLFAQESQFWPGVFRVPYEAGLGQLTDVGADTVLLWNTSFYEEFCPLVLAEDTCAQGYLHLKPDEKALLRGALANQANVDCADCPTGVDLASTEFSVELFATTLQASCDQLTQIVYNATGEKPGLVSSYEDLWRLTVANYHAGPGCLSYAVYAAWTANGTRLLWDDVATRFTTPCQGVVPYVEKITR
ncbi:MAG: hypothetical protein A2W33_02540 [Chloroflexi bacterium RBG_16_52_11]|nr:MAG: hypothetical protein A2W33_02540 [Chloroflexi bacterium RBG_16_52_11]